MKWLIQLVLAVLLLMWPMPAGAARPDDTQASVSWRMVGQIGGATTCVAVSGSYAFVGVGLRLEVVDVSDPAEMRPVGATAPFPHFVEGVALDPARPYAYVAAGGAGLRVVDISDPLHPAEVGALDSLGYSEGVAVAGTTAYLADGPYGLRIIDVSNPPSPREIACAYDMNYAFDVAVSGAYAYIAAAGAGLLVADVSDPAHPVEVGSLDTEGYAYGVAAVGSTVYVADGWEGLRLVSAEDPAHPTQIGYYKTPGWAFGVAVSGTRAYVADAFKGLRVLDVLDPAHPRELGGYEVSGGHAGNVVVAGDVAYVADRNWGLRAVRVTDPALPAQVGFYGPMGYAGGVSVLGNYAYVAAGSYGLRVVDVSDPHRPVQVGVGDTQSGTSYISAIGQYVYMTTWPGVDGADQGLQVVDISDAAHPKTVGHYHNPSGGRDLEVVDGIAYLPDEWGLELVSVSDPFNPGALGFIRLGEIGGSDLAIGVTVSGTLAYVASGTAGVEFVDVEDPSNPRWIGAYNGNSFEPSDVLVVGNVLYGSEYHALRILDISNPTSPSEIALYPTLGQGNKAVVSGTVAYLAAGDLGVSAVDVSDPHHPTLAWTCDTVGYVHEVAVVGNRVYAADGPNGLVILEAVTNGPASDPGPEFEGSASIAGAPGASGLSDTALWLNANQSGPSVVPQSCPPAWTAVPYAQSEPLETGGTSSMHASPQSPDEATSLRSSSDCVVSSAGDSGLGTLRWCLANALAGQTVTFSPLVFPPANPVTISVTSQLPWLTQGNVTIDAGNASVVLDGTNAPPDTPGLVVASDHNAVKGLQIVSFAGDGVQIRDGAKSNCIGGDRSRGNGPMGEGNRISANGGNGVSIFGSGTMSNTVSGNFVGTDLSGTVAIGNQNGILIAEAASHNTIGGDREGERNVIGGNRGADVAIGDAGTTHNIVENNLIGTDSTGKAAVRTVPPGGGCCTVGVQVAGGAQHNTVGPGNVINGEFFGVQIVNNGTDDNIVIGNLIGTDTTGTSGIGNFCIGIYVGGGAQSNRIGGSTSRERNVISGNGVSGVSIGDRGTISNTVVGNFVGTDISGMVALGNMGPGGAIHVWSSGNQIGGANTGERNVVSGNMDSGIVLQGSGATGNTVMGNYAGTDASGMMPLGNKGVGIGVVGGAPSNVIRGNVVSGNGGDGIQVCDTGADYNVVVGNLVGTDSSGTIPIPNGGGGVRICPGLYFNRVGGTKPDERNLLSGNTYGVVFGGADNLVLGNLIGTDISGTQPLGNWASGVHLDPGGRNFVGGATTAERNVISGNGTGVYACNDFTYVLGNLIGTDISGAKPLGNAGSFGVEIGASHCIVQGNTIAHNPRGVMANRFPRNTLRRNSIHSNASKGIALYGGGNAMLPEPVIRAVDGTSVSGTCCPGCTIEVFSDDEDEGRVYEGTAVADAQGHFAFTAASGLAGPFVTATATDADGNTSEFSAPRAVVVGRLYLPLLLRQ
jgi:hypothetical protein